MAKPHTMLSGTVANDFSFL
jgi:hypothetical protein